MRTPGCCAPVPPRRSSLPQVPLSRREGLHLWQEDAQEPALLVRRGAVRSTLREETQVRRARVQEILPPTRRVRRCRHSRIPLLTALWTGAKILRTHLSRAMPCPPTLQGRQALPLQNIHHLPLPTPQARSPLPRHQAQPPRTLLLPLPKMRRRMSPSPAQPPTSRRAQHRPRDPQGRAHPLL